MISRPSCDEWKASTTLGPAPAIARSPQLEGERQDRAAEARRQGEPPKLTTGAVIGLKTTSTHAYVENVARLGGGAAVGFAGSGGGRAEEAVALGLAQSQ